VVEIEKHWLSFVKYKSPSPCPYPRLVTASSLVDDGACQRCCVSIWEGDQLSKFTDHWPQLSSCHRHSNVCLKRVYSAKLQTDQTSQAKALLTTDPSTPSLVSALPHATSPNSTRPTRGTEGTGLHQLLLEKVDPLKVE
jgi:hypothetical protein